MRVGRITLAIQAETPHRGLILPVKYRPFSPDRGGEIRLNLVESGPPPLAPSDLLFDSGSLWRVYRLGRKLAYTFRSADGSDPFRRVVVIDSSRRRGWLFLPPFPENHLAGSAFSYPLDEILFQHRSACRGALFLHACGIAVGDRAFLFCGQSEAGKTTTANLWHKHHPRAVILSDDRLVVQQYRGRWCAYGTPWHGSGRFATPQGCPLAGIFFLRHGAENHVEPLTPTVAATQLFPRTFPPMWEPAIVDRVLATCGRVAAEVPCARLSFRPDEAIVQMIAAQYSL